VPTTFTKLLGQDKLDISTSADVKWGIKKLEVALALDNTGSMAQNSKLTQLKTAAHICSPRCRPRQAAGRRQGRDHPVRYRRECRNRLQGRVLGRLYGQDYPEERVDRMRDGSRPVE